MTKKPDPSDLEAGRLIEYGLKMISGKWKWIVVGLLYKRGVLRFGEIMSILQKPTDRVLSRQLRELEQDHIVLRESYNEVPPRVEYSLTEKGKDIIPIIYPLMQWGEKYKKDIPKSTVKKKTYW